MITFACQCGKQLQATADLIGRAARCPVCAATLTIPGDEQPLPFVAQPVGLAVEVSEPCPPADEPTRATALSVGRSRLATISCVLGCVALAGALGQFIQSGLGLGHLALFGLPAVIFGVMAQQRIRQSERSLTGGRTAAAGIGTGAFSLLLGVIGAFFLSIEMAQTAGRRAESLNNMHNIGIALINYHDTMGEFPPTDKNGLSWRVHILDFLECSNLSSKFHLDEPWDSPDNLKMLHQMPNPYRSPLDDRSADPWMTHYRMVTGQGTWFDDALQLKGKGLPIAPSSRLLIVETTEAVPWTKPDEVVYDPQGPLPALGSASQPSFLALFGDGHVQVIRKSVNEQALRAQFARKLE